MNSAILDVVQRHPLIGTESRFVYVHRWQADDVIMWDNRCTMHAVMPYEHTTYPRVMHRTTIVGDERPT